MHLSALIAQIPVSTSIPANLDFMDSVLQQSAPGDLVLFPEGCISGYDINPAFLEEIDAAALSAAFEHLQTQAAERGIDVWAGACIRRDGQWFNCAYGFTAAGDTRVYTKINLANHERGVFAAGSRLPVFDLQRPEGAVRIGVQICRELRYPEQWGWLARQGAQVFLHLNNAVGAAAYQPVWKSHLVSRAAETQRFVLSANNAAQEQISPSLAIGPDGFVMAEVVSEKLEMLRVELDLSRVSGSHLGQCRTDVVKIQAASHPDDQRKNTT
jgi:predicted amidohydrolase